MHQVLLITRISSFPFRICIAATRYGPVLIWRFTYIPNPRQASLMRVRGRYG